MLYFHNLYYYLDFVPGFSLSEYSIFVITHVPKFETITKFILLIPLCSCNNVKIVFIYPYHISKSCTSHNYTLIHNNLFISVWYLHVYIDFSKRYMISNAM